MKRITLKKMSLRNFKGIRELDVELNDDATSVYGKNGTGKTTLFDAFTWVLFGKDSRDREKFQLMTLNPDGQEIPRLKHEVTLTLDIDGKTVTLTRRKNEKWTKKRGSAIEEKTGTEEERIYNDIPCSVSEWNEKIKEICSYNVFKFITSPTYFTAQKPETQREILFAIVGGITNEDIAKGNDEFCALIAQLDGKTMDEYKREIGAKKKRIKTELDEYPIRIKECNSVIDSFADVDFGAIEQEIAEKKQKLADINANLTSVKKSISDNEKRIGGISEKIGDVFRQKIEIERAIKEDVFRSHDEAVYRHCSLKLECSRLKSLINSLNSEISDKECEAQRMTEQRNECLAELKRIKADAQTLTFSTEDFRCPTCGQMLEVKDIEAKKRDIERKFNEIIARRLEANKAAGQRCSMKLIEQIKEKTNLLIAKLNDTKSSLEAAEQELSQIIIPAAPTQADIDKRLSESAEYQALIAEDERLGNELKAPFGTTKDTDDEIDDINEARALLQSSIDELNQTLGKKDFVENRKALIKTYEYQMRLKSEELAELEGIEFTIMEFAKARVKAVEDKINSLFSTVKFKMFDYQLNGGWKETCEATVGGIPYSVLNNAMKINAGLDIINAICKHYGTTAPVFIDNAESVNELIPMLSQVIRLVVTTDPKLIIK